MPVVERNAPVADTMGPDARFRDPEPPETAARALRLRIAHALVRAPALPVEIPAVGLRLLDIDADRRGIELRFGLDDPMAAVRLEEGPERPFPLQASVRMLVLAAHRYKAALEAIADRLRGAIDADRWAQARDAAALLRRLPSPVPLGFHRQLVQGVDEPTGQVRTGFGCNQDCGICWQGRDWGTYGSEQIHTWIEDLFNAGARKLIISGGEPTLDPALEEYVRRARSLGFTGITLETNAMLLGKPDRAERLRAAGLADAFVSFHSADAATSDAVTRAPGTFVKTVRGIEALLQAGVPVFLNTVMTAEGIDHLHEMPDFIHERFGRYGNLLRRWMLSYPTAAFSPELNASIVPSPTHLREVLRATIDRAFALGLEPKGLDGPCGPALCAFDADPRITALTQVPGPVEFREHVPACESCAVRSACFGVRSLDVALFGPDCVFPIAVAPLRS